MNRQQRRAANRENAKRPARLVEVPREEWPAHATPVSLVRVWHSRRYLVQLHDEWGGRLRLAICRTQLDATGWQDGIAWDELQRIKAEVGFSGHWAVECYPPDGEVVNVANMRHLWLLPEPPAFGWRKQA